MRWASDLAVTGFDGIAGSAHTQPPLTTVSQPSYAIARQLAQMLLVLLNGEQLPDRRVVVQPELVVRASTGS